MKLSTEKVWEDFSSSLRAFIGRRISNHSHAEDVLQDVFVKIHRSIALIEDETKLRSWVYQVARNTIIDYYRRNKLKTEEIASDEIANKLDESMLTFSNDENPSESPNHEIASGLKDMIGQLPEKYAQALLLVEFEGVPQTELAKRLGISVSGAKSRVQRGRQMLKDILMRCCHFELDRYGTIIDYYPHCCCCEVNACEGGCP